jgi:hypothetical protein
MKSSNPFRVLILGKRIMACQSHYLNKDYLAGLSRHYSNLELLEELVRWVDGMGLKTLFKNIEIMDDYAAP